MLEFPVDISTSYHKSHCVAVEAVLQWRHNERHGVSNHQPHDCLLNHVFMRRLKKASKHRVTGLVTGELHAQRVSNVENAFIWWRHYAENIFQYDMLQ